jgi:hypothetical protein
MCVAEPSTFGDLSSAMQSREAAGREAVNDASAAVDLSPDEGTRESRTSEASIAGSVVQGALNTTASTIDARGRQAAHNTLTNGNAGNFNAPNGAKQADIAADFTRSTNTAQQALDATPYSSAAKSTQQLADAAERAGRFSKAAGPVGTLAGPAIGAIEAAFEPAPNATIGDRVANVIGGGLKEADDTVVSAVSGTAVTVGQVAVSPFTGPAAPAVAVTAPLSGAAAAIGASEAYDKSAIDNTFDAVVDNYVEPAIAATVDGLVQAGRAAKSTISSAFNAVKSWF